MTWMAETFERRADPRKLMPDAKSIVMLGLNYGPEADPLAALSRPEAGAISVYARHRDYHDVLKGKLKELAAFLVAAARPEKTDVKVFVDTAPLLEKPLAARAGLGWQGKHTNLVSREFRLLAVPGRDPHEPRACRPTRRNRTIADNAAPASTRVRQARFRRPIGSTRGAAFPISRSSTRAQFRGSFDPRSAIASTDATTALPSARGTSSRALGGKRNLRRAPTSTRRPSPNSPASTMRRSGPCSPAARSSGSAGRASCAM